MALSREASPPAARIVERLAATEPSEPFFARVLTALMQELLARYGVALDAFEEAVSSLEDLPADQPGKGSSSAPSS